jgi:GxxExxY protein
MAKDLHEVEESLNELSSAVIGAAIAVHRALGPGFLESVYEEALCLELTNRGIRFERQVSIAVQYKGQPIGEGRLDLLVDSKIVVELKAVETILPIHQAQVLSYLKMTGHHLGLLINFNVSILKDGINRIIL